MSLICGIVSRRNTELASEAALEAMLRATAHRARDGSRRFLDPPSGVALGFQYTATFGLPAAEPSWHDSDDLVVAVDGEVYAAEEPPGGNSTLHGRSQAGLVAAAFASDPAAFPAGLDGFFSLMVWDRKSETLRLSADAMTRKQVYYYNDPARDLVVFSSELKGVLAHPAVPVVLDRRSLALYLGFSNFPAPITPIEGIRKLSGAESLEFSPHGCLSRRHLRPQIEAGPDDFEFWVERTRAELLGAVRRSAGLAPQLAFYLSGGGDSSTVLAALKSAGGPPVEAFTLVYKDHAAAYDLPYARRVAALTATRHHVLELDPESALTPAVAEAVLRQIDEPFESASRAFNEYFLAEAVRRLGFDSVLTGHVPGFNLTRLRRYLQSGTSTGSAVETVRAALQSPLWFSEAQMNRALVEPADLSALDEAVLCDCELWEGMDEVQAFSLAQRFSWQVVRDSAFAHIIPPLFGLEERTPFMDTRMSLLALSVPPSLRGLESADQMKATIMAAFQDELQIDFSERQKTPYPACPLPSWLEALLLPRLKVLAEDGIIKPRYLDWLERNIGLGRKRARSEAWFWFVFACWYVEYVRREALFEGLAPAKH